MVWQRKYGVLKLVLSVLFGLGFQEILPAHAESQFQPMAPLVINQTRASLPMAQLSIFQSLEKLQKQAEFVVELARTPQSQRQGLMYRSELAENAGMLFIFNKPRQARFWMRNTLIPLDMIFIKTNGEIETIVTRWDTQSDQPSLSTGHVRYVLEINAGLAQKLGIEVGQFIQLSTLP